MKMIVTGGTINDGKAVYHPGEEFEAATKKEANRLFKLGVAKPVVEKKAEPEDPAANSELELAAVELAINAGEVTKSGKPKVEALEKYLDKELTSAQRDEIWSRYQDAAVLH